LLGWTPVDPLSIYQTAVLLTPSVQTCMGKNQSYVKHLYVSSFIPTPMAHHSTIAREKAWAKILRAIAELTQIEWNSRFYEFFNIIEVTTEKVHKLLYLFYNI